MILPGMRHGYASGAAYVNRRRADYFCRYLLGKTEDSVDIVELNREQQQNGSGGSTCPRTTAGPCSLSC